MKQKYFILKDDEQKKLIIKEFAELNKEIFSLLCEEKYDDKAIESAIKKGEKALISKLRTKNMYPPGIYAEKIAEAVIDMYGSREKQSVELYFNDIELLTKDEEEKTQEIIDEAGGTSDEINKAIGDDLEEDFEEKTPIKKINSSIKIADDEYVDVDKES